MVGVAELEEVVMVGVAELEGLVVLEELESASVELGSSLLKTTADTISFSVSRGGRGEMPSFLSTFSKPSSFSEMSPLLTPEVDEKDSAGIFAVRMAML